MRTAAFGAIGALILGMVAAPAMAGGYYDAGPPPGYGPPPCHRGCPPPCPPPRRWREGPPEMGPPPEWNGPPPAAYNEGYDDGYNGFAPAEVFEGGVGDDEGFVDDGGAGGVGIIDFAGRGRDFRRDHDRDRFFDHDRAMQREHQSESQQMHSYERQSVSEHAYAQASAQASAHAQARVYSRMSRSYGGSRGGGRR